LKLIISAGIDRVCYETPFNSGDNARVRDFLLQGSTIEIGAIGVPVEIATHAASLLLEPTSIAREAIVQ
jgi:dCMP deaminase